MCSTHGVTTSAGGRSTPATETFEHGLGKADAVLAMRVLEMSTEEQATEYKDNWMPAETRENRDEAKLALQERYTAARQLGEVVARTRANAQRIKKGLNEQGGSDPHTEAVMEREMRLCKDSVAKLQALKQEIESSQVELAAGNSVLEREFEAWLEGMRACARDHTPRGQRPATLDTRLGNQSPGNSRLLSPAERIREDGRRRGTGSSP